LTREKNQETAELVEKAEKENNTQELQLEEKNLEQSGLSTVAFTAENQIQSTSNVQLPPKDAGLSQIATATVSPPPAILLIPIIMIPTP
jgi:hypothetical protein